MPLFMEGHFPLFLVEHFLFKKVSMPPRRFARAVANQRIRAAFGGRGQALPILGRNGALQRGRFNVRRRFNDGQIPVDNITLEGFQEPLDDQRLYNLVREWVGRSGNLRRTWVTFTYQGNGVLAYRSVRGSRLRTFAQFREQLRRFENPEIMGSDPIGLDLDGQIPVLVRNAFSVNYFPGDQPDIVACASEDGFGSSEPAPFYQTLALDIPNAAHCVDRVCWQLQIPLYSVALDTIVPPLRNDAMAYIERALAARHGLDSPSAVVHIITPWTIAVEESHVHRLRDAFYDEPANAVSLDDCLVHGSYLYIRVQPWNLWSLHDPEHRLRTTGPRLLMLANNHVEYVPTFYDAETKMWLPKVRGELFFGPSFGMFELVRSARVKNPEPLETMRAFPTADPLHTILEPVEDLSRDLRQLRAAGNDAALHYRQKRLSQLPKGWMFRKVMSNTQLMTQKVKGKHVRVYYDFETVHSLEAGKLKPYSCAYLVMESGERDTRLLRNEIPTEELVRRSIVVTGFDCHFELAKVVKELAVSGQYETITMAGFNSARFDAFLFMEGTSMLQDRDKEDGMYASRLTWINHFFQGGSLLGGEMRVRSYRGLSPTRVRLFDLAKHLTGTSLKNAAKDFGTPHQKVDCFSHSEVQSRFLDDPEGFLTDRRFLDQLHEYNKYDVIVLAELDAAYCSALAPLTPLVYPGSELPATIGSLCFQHWQSYFTKLLEDKPEVLVGPALSQEQKDKLTVCGAWEALDLDKWLDLRNGIVGGRVELPNGPQDVDECVSSLDVKGLYSFVMGVYDVWFPAGVFVPLVGRQESPDLLGVYNVDVDQSPMRAQDLVNIVPRKEYSTSGSILRNNWNADHVYDTWVTTPTLQLLRRYGCPVVIRGGFEWSHKIRSCDLFGCLLDFMKEKKRQDHLKEARDPAYNKAIRSVAKLFMNATYGQMLKGIFERGITSVTVDQLRKLYEKEESGEVVRINVVNVLHGNIFADVTRSTESRLKKQGPFAVGAFVLGHSRSYMLKYLYLRLPRSRWLYFDTDAGKARKRHMVELMDAHRGALVPHWPEIEDILPGYASCPLYGGDEGGAFEEELPENAGAVLIAKKFYAVRGLDGGVCMDGNTPVMACKGVRRDDIPLNELELSVIDCKLLTSATRLAYCHDLYHHQNRDTVVDCGIEFFRHILAHGFGFVLSSSLGRVTANMARGVMLGDVERYAMQFGSLIQHFRVKKLSVTQMQREEDVICGRPMDQENAEERRGNAWRRYLATIQDGEEEQEREEVRAVEDYEDIL